MNCKGCNFAYDTKNRKPIVLVGCGHSVCQLCVVQLREQAENEAHDESIYRKTSVPKKMIERKLAPAAQQFLDTGKASLSKVK